MILVITKHLKSHLFRDLYYTKMTIDEAEMKQDEFNGVLRVLSTYSARGEKYIESKNKLLNNATNFFKGQKNY